MRIHWNKDWTTSAAVGVVSFAAGVGVGVFGYRTKINRDIDKGLEAMHELSGLDKMVRVGTVESIEPTEGGLSVKGRIESSFDLDTSMQHVKLMEDFVKAVNGDNEAEVTVSDHSQGVAMDIPRSDEVEIVDPPESESMEDTNVQAEPQRHNVFVRDWNQEEEEESRTTDAPYIINSDEFFANEKDYRQCTLEYYEGDGVLVDEHSVPIYDANRTVGRLVFGHGSPDPNTVYVRNDMNSAEYEIVRNPGHYQVEVMGLEIEEQAERDELKHSQRVLRFRME